jgi:hypothetical protein
VQDERCKREARGEKKNRRKRGVQAERCKQRGAEEVQAERCTKRGARGEELASGEIKGGCKQREVQERRASREMKVERGASRGRCK